MKHRIITIIGLVAAMITVTVVIPLSVILTRKGKRNPSSTGSLSNTTTHMWTASSKSTVGSTATATIDATNTTNTNLMLSTSTMAYSRAPGSPCQLDFYPLTSSRINYINSPEATAVADLNGDSYLDIAAISWRVKLVIVLLGYGNGSFRVAANLSDEGSGGYEAIMIHDFNNDTHSDIFVLNRFDQQIEIFLGNGDGSFQAQLITTVGFDSALNHLDVGDVNNDGWLDIVAIKHESNEFRMFLGYGNGSFQAQNRISTGNRGHSSSLVMEDFNSDGQADIIVADTLHNLVRVYLGFVNGTFQTQASDYYTRSPFRIRSVDLNGDAVLDFSVMSHAVCAISLFFSHGNGTFYPGPVLNFGKAVAFYWFEFADLANDGHRDFIITDAAAGDVFILPGNGDGSFRAMKTFQQEADARPRWVSVGDFNNDNQLDLAVVKDFINRVDLLLNRC